MRAAYALLAVTFLMSCQRNSDKPTAEENRQLDDAANLLDQAPSSLNGIDDSSLNSANVSDENAF